MQSIKRNKIKRFAELNEGLGIIMIFLGMAIITINSLPVIMQRMSFGAINPQSPFFSIQLLKIGSGVTIWGIAFLIGIPTILLLILIYFKDLLKVEKT